MAVAYTDPVQGMIYDRDDPYWRDIVECGFRAAECFESTPMPDHPGDMRFLKDHLYWIRLAQMPEVERSSR